MTEPTNGRGSLALAHAIAKIPVRDLDRARSWYREKLGLELGTWFRDCDGNVFGLGQPTR